ncbi:hypothetical protein MSAN_00651100 [Mycena sanguinolenta]|uniref:Uncharacterized protein n=1 Tax=Mycena sanguinolenta TaxID=230812 RepID=A0A8H6Z034_9AGAR|nr:hypothetical protein MSAN_00651100 [Mycena sanguinolenta]
MPEDVFLTSPRKPANRRSNASLRPLSSPDSSFADGGGGGGGGGFSLAHELAVAMMPEPSAGSKLLAEEFGIETRILGMVGTSGSKKRKGKLWMNMWGGDADADPAFASPTRAAPARRKEPEVDAMQVLAADLASTDNFLSHLRRLDADASLPPSLSSTSTSSSAFPASPSSSSTAFAASSSALNGSDDDSKLLSGQPALERLASDVIRRINDTARDRETQLRELLQYEREFRRIEAEVGGKDVLGRLDELDFPPDDEPEPPLALTTELDSAVSPQAESPVVRPKHLRALSQDWETDPDYDRLGDAQEEGRSPRWILPSPIPTTTPPPPRLPCKPLSPPPTNAPPPPPRILPRHQQNQHPP